MAREHFLKNPHGVTKKLFTEANGGTLSDTKEEQDDHIKQ